MAWTDTEDFKVGQLVTHVANAQKGSLRSLKDNLNFLHGKNMASYFHDGTGADWTTTSESLVAIDATKFQVTITSTGGPIMTWFQGAVRRNSGSAFYAFFTIARIGDAFDLYEPTHPMWANRWKPVTLQKPYYNLPAGSHTFVVQWQISGGTVAVALDSESKPFFLAVEGI